MSEEVRNKGAGISKFLAGDFATGVVADEEEALAKLAEKGKASITISVIPRYSGKTLTKAEDVFTIKIDEDNMKEASSLIKKHLKKLIDSKIIDEMMARVEGEINHG